MGSLELLNAIYASPKVQDKGLLYIDANIDGKAITAMVDMGASHNFVSIEEAQRLGHRTTDGGGSIKAVNSEAWRIKGVTCGVQTKFGTQDGPID